jgi:hypothetical protein
MLHRADAREEQLVLRDAVVEARARHGGEGLVVHEAHGLDVDRHHSGFAASVPRLLFSRVVTAIT